MPTENKNQQEEAPKIAVLETPSLEVQLEIKTKEASDLSDLVLLRNKQISEYQDDIKALTQKIEDAEKNPFLRIVGNVDKGRSLDEAGRLMNELCDAVTRLQEKGTLVFKVDVKPFKGKPGTLLVKPELKSAPPGIEPEVTIFFYDDQNGLTQEQYRQREMTFTISK